MLVKLIVVILLLAIVGSLFSGLYFLVKDKGETKRLVHSLTIRIGLSVFAFIVLMIAALTGVIKPHGF
ncbi:MAG: twin transmembrane helix small protein [Pseudomonadota bacterium]